MSQFFEYSKSIVTDFLQTAVFLDDKAKYGEEVSESIPSAIINPISGDSEPATPNAESNPTPNSEHDLDATKIIDSFTEKGIVCSVIKCTEVEFESKKNGYLKLMQKADIIVLDWDLFDDGGDKILEIIAKLVQGDEELKELRSIVIYTAHDLEVIQEKLRVKNILFESQKFISINNQYTTVSLFNKPGMQKIPARTVAFENLVDICINEFAETFHGIVPNVAMAAIAEIRKNTHKLLGVLNKDLDPAYLSHRALLPTQEKSDAEKHLEEIIISEIESIVHENQVGKKAEYDVIKNTPILTGRTFKDNPFDEYLKSRKFNDDDVAKACLTKEWSDLDEIKSKNSEKEFAILTLLQTNYTKKKKYLTLGVVLKDGDNYYLCIQPRCDSVRLIESNDFSFLELQKSTATSGFDFIFRDETQRYQLNFNKKYRKIFTFPASENGTVESMVESDENIFTNTSGGKYTYVATLKKSQAQRVANEYAAHISRVGLNGSEYLRRNRPK